MDLNAHRIAGILDNLSEAFMVMDAGGRISHFNAAAMEVTGFDASEVMGRQCRDVFNSGECGSVCPICAPDLSPGAEVNRVFEIREKNGSRIRLASKLVFVTDTKGKICGGVEIFNPVSKPAPSGTPCAESRFRRLFERTKDMIFLISETGAFLDINQAMVDLLDYGSKQELYDLNNIEHLFIDPIHWAVCKRQIDMNGFVQDFEAGFKKKDGTRLHGCMSVTVSRDEKGRIIGYEGIAKDITARMDSFRSLYKRHQELLLLNTVAVTMNSSQSLEAVLHKALSEVMKILGFGVGALFLINREKARFDLQTHLGLPPEIITSSLPPRFHDTQLESFFLMRSNRLEPRPIFPSFKITLENPGKTQAVTLTCFLVTEKERPSGFMAFSLEDHNDLGLEDFHLLGSLGNFVGGALANIKLMRTVQKHREELKRLTAKLFQSQETACKRISRELHDETGSALIGINFNLEALEKALPANDPVIKNLTGNIKRQINLTFQEMRRISHLLHPALLTDLGLEPALDAHMNSVSRQCPLKIDFKMIGFKGRLSPDMETVLYRFSQEALSNTVKYARASCFKLSIIKGFPHIIFIAEDDGIGFDPDESHHKRPALGLVSMRERTAILGGRFRLRTAKGKGTRIRIEIPVKNDTLGSV